MKTKPANKKTFVLTADVPNPHLDKRCRYGLKSAPVFKAGSKFTVTYYTADDDLAKRFPQLIGTPKHICLHDLRFGDLLEEKWLRDALLPVAVEATEAPKNLNEIQKTYGDIARGEHIINQLLKAGVITVEQVVEASDAHTAEQA